MNVHTRKTYIEEPDNYQVIRHKSTVAPTDAWSIPFVTGHRYKLHWRNGLDFTKLRIDLSEPWKWNRDDKSIVLAFNFTDVRARVDVTADEDLIDNGTLVTRPASQLESGDYVVYN